ncbi:9036_t:CDS:1, partial [Funneliformis mosseae]
RSPSPSPKMSSSRLKFDNEILGNLEDNTDVLEDSMPDFPFYNKDIGATNNRLEEEKVRLL